MRFLLSAIDFSDISTNIGNICVIELLGTFQNEISCLFRKTRHFFGIDSENIATFSEYNPKNSPSPQLPVADQKKRKTGEMSRLYDLLIVKDFVFLVIPLQVFPRYCRPYQKESASRCWLLFSSEIRFLQF